MTHVRHYPRQKHEDGEKLCGNLLKDWPWNRSVDVQELEEEMTRV